MEWFPAEGGLEGRRSPGWQALEGTPKLWPLPESWNSRVGMMLGFAVLITLCRGTGNIHRPLGLLLQNLHLQGKASLKPL